MIELFKSARRVLLFYSACVLHVAVWRLHAREAVRAYADVLACVDVAMTCAVAVRLPESQSLHRQASLAAWRVVHAVAACCCADPACRDWRVMAAADDSGMQPAVIGFPRPFAQ